MQPSQAKAILLLDAYSRAGLDPWPSRGSLVLLLYLLQAGGDDLGLQFVFNDTNNLKLIGETWVDSLEHDGHIVRIDDQVVGEYLQINEPSLLMARTLPESEHLNRTIRLIDGWEGYFGLKILALEHHWRSSHGRDMPLPYPSHPFKGVLKKAIATLADNGWI